MFWGDKITEEARTQLASTIKSGKKLIVRDEKTASGRVHVGSMRGVAIHGTVADILERSDVPVTFLMK